MKCLVLNLQILVALKAMVVMPFERPWQKLHADFKEPIGEQYCLHIIVNQYSKYSEVDIFKSTSL